MNPLLMLITLLSLQSIWTIIQSCNFIIINLGCLSPLYIFSGRKITQMIFLVCLTYVYIINCWKPYMYNCWFKNHNYYTPLFVYRWLQHLQMLAWSPLISLLVLTSLKAMSGQVNSIYFIVSTMLKLVTWITWHILTFVKLGAKSFNRRSLHHVGDDLNPYEQAISIIGKTLASFDEDNLIPCFGFGDGTFF